MVLTVYLGYSEVRKKHLAIVEMQSNSYDIMCSDDKISNFSALRG
jgi:hypothetical protein